MADARRYSRLSFHSVSRLVDKAEGRTYTTHLIDISLKGALVQQPPGWAPPPGARARLEIRLPDSPVRIRMEAEVAHAGEGRLGLHCVAIDLDSLTHLRRLLELNLGDPALLQRELFALG